jgi:hypothetical protein
MNSSRALSNASCFAIHIDSDWRAVAIPSDDGKRGSYDHDDVPSESMDSPMDAAFSTALGYADLWSSEVRL